MRNPNDFYDGIAKRQAELIQKQHEELTKQARMNAMNALRRQEFSSAPDECTIFCGGVRMEKKNDSTAKTKITVGLNGKGGSGSE